MKQISFRSMVLAFAFLFLAQGEAAPVRGARTPPTPSTTARVPAPGQIARTTETSIPYFTCSGLGSNGPVNFWLGDYQGKRSLRLTGTGVGTTARNYYVPVNMSMAKSADGKSCNLSVTRVGGTDPLTFQFPMAQGPNFLKRTNTSSGKSPPCSSYETSASAALKTCTTPNVMTKSTMPESCKPIGPSANEAAYACQVVGKFTKKPVSAYSMKYCQDSPRGSEAHTDYACVAQIICNRRPLVTRAAFDATRDWPKQYASYVSCRPGLSGLCDKTVDECRADKSIYFANKERGEAAIRLDVGIDAPAAASIAAPSPAAAPAANTNPWGDAGSSAPRPAAQSQRFPPADQGAESFRAGDIPTNQRQRWPTAPQRRGAQ